MAQNRFDMGPQDIAWCPGCGDYGILQVLKDTLFELGYQPEGVVFVSGIGQAAKTPHYIKGNFFNGLHGRSLPPATGVSLSNPNMKVIVTSGDGDMYGEGGNHFIHTIRRNPDITVFVYNNMIYGLTKGQASPTSQKGMVTPVQTHGVFLEPFNPLAVAISLDASFVARTSIADPEHVKEIMKKAVQHKGFSLVDIFQPCVSFNKLNTYDWFTEHTYKLENHDPSDRMQALQKALENGEKMPLGVFYIHEKPTLNEFMYHENKIDGALYAHNVDMKKVDALIDSKKQTMGEAPLPPPKETKKEASAPSTEKVETSAGSKYRVQIQEIIEETPSVKSFVFRVPGEYEFKAGQDLMVSFPDEHAVNGKKSIPLSISNPPTDHNKVILTIRNMGGFTAELHKLQEGDELMITAPVGKTFAVEEDSEDNFVFIAGGTGITPFISIMRMFLAKGKKNNITFLDANKNKEEIIFKKELDRIAEEQGHIKIIHTLDTCPVDWEGEEGFICPEMIEKHLSDEELKERTWFICGPPPMIKQMKDVIKKVGVPEKNVHIEDWQLPGQDGAPKEPVEKPEQQPQETTKMEEPQKEQPQKEQQEQPTESGKAILASASQEVEVQPGPIMGAAEELGVPFSCRQGICGTCEVKVTEGLENLEPQNEKEKNMKLPEDHHLCCQSKIKGGKVKLDF
jgi:2-oxoglutarate ferredoxin oxidoreductase subunit beta